MLFLIFLIYFQQPKHVESQFDKFKELYNNGDKDFKPKNNFTIKYADQSHDLEWLVNEFI